MYMISNLCYLYNVNYIIYLLENLSMSFLVYCFAMFNLSTKYLLCTVCLSVSINVFSELSNPKDIDDRHYTKKNT